MFSCRLQLLRADPEHHRPGAAEAQRLGGPAQAQQRAGGRPPTRGRQQHHDAHVRWAAAAWGHHRVPGSQASGRRAPANAVGGGTKGVLSRFMGSARLGRCHGAAGRSSLEEPLELDPNGGEQPDVVQVHPEGWWVSILGHTHPSPGLDPEHLALVRGGWTGDFLSPLSEEGGAVVYMGGGSPSLEM